MARSQLTGGAEAIRELKKYSPELYKQLRKDLNSDLNPVIKPIQGEINSEVTTAMRDKMKGMFHSGRSAWTGANISARISTNPKSLITIVATGRTSKFGFDYAELAGIQRRKPRPTSRSYTKNGVTMTHAVNGQGYAFNNKLRQEFGKPGRFAWIRILRRKPIIERKVLDIAEKYNITLNRKLG